MFQKLFFKFLTVNKFNYKLRHALFYTFLCRDRAWSSVIGFLVQLESFNYTIVNNDQQRRVYELLFEVSSYSETPTPSINHDYTVKIDGVIKISVQKISQSDCNKFLINMFKNDHEKS